MLDNMVVASGSLRFRTDAVQPQLTICTLKLPSSSLVSVVPLSSDDISK